MSWIIVLILGALLAGFVQGGDRFWFGNRHDGLSAQSFTNKSKCGSFDANDVDCHNYVSLAISQGVNS